MDSNSPLGRLLPRRLWRTPAGDAWGPLPELLLILTVVTGIVDAVSILALGRVFVANMTGNVVFAGFAIAGAPGFSLGASLFALAGFLIGAALGGRMTAKVGHDHALHLRSATVSEFALLAVALIVAAAFGGPAAIHGTLHLATGTATFGTGIMDALAALLAVAMGIQNALARKLAVPDLTTTVLTMTLTGIGQDSRTGHRGHVTLSRRVLVVATMLAGGVVGAELVLNVGTIVPLAPGHRPARHRGGRRGRRGPSPRRMAQGQRVSQASHDECGSHAGHGCRTQCRVSRGFGRSAVRR